MKCQKCTKDKEMASGQALCIPCFCDIIEQRAAKSLRGKIESDTSLLVLGNTTSYLLKKFLKFSLKLDEKNISDFGESDLFSLLKSGKLADYLSEKNMDYAVLPWTADHEACRLLMQFFEGAKFELSEKTVPLLSEISLLEIAEYCKIKNLSWQNEKMPECYDFILAAEAANPGIVHSLSKSSKKFSEILQKAAPAKVL